MTDDFNMVMGGHFLVSRDSDRKPKNPGDVNHEFYAEIVLENNPDIDFIGGFGATIAAAVKDMAANFENQIQE